MSLRGSRPQWLAYSKTGDNLIRGIMVWSKRIYYHKIIIELVDVWFHQIDGLHLYF
jgi:hypothetical protein